MNPDYLEVLQKQEERKLDSFLSSAIETINLSKYSNEVFDLFLLNDYEGYNDVLAIEYVSGMKAYINISCNSIEATARVLFNYIYYGAEQTQGFIKEEY